MPRRWSVVRVAALELLGRRRSSCAARLGVFFV